MINWNAFYAGGGYCGECDPGCYDDDRDDDWTEEDYEAYYEGDGDCDYDE